MICIYQEKIHRIQAALASEELELLCQGFNTDTDEISEAISIRSKLFKPSNHNNKKRLLFSFWYTEEPMPGSSEMALYCVDECEGHGCIPTQECIEPFLELVRKGGREGCSKTAAAA